jgi:hypothetical protein
MRQSAPPFEQPSRDSLPETSGTNLEVNTEDLEESMNLAEIEAVFRQEWPASPVPGGKCSRYVKFFIDKAERKLYPPRFICDGPTLRG